MTRDRGAAGSDSPSLEAVLDTIRRLLADLGIADPSDDAVIVAADFEASVPALIRDPRSLERFCMGLAVALRFVGYRADEIASLTIRQLGELYLADSHPALPASPLADSEYDRIARPARRGRPSPREWPIVFVLGCPRSGTTLLRAMLDRHSQIWAPGELHLAQYDDMSERARRVAPVLRRLPVPELAGRFGESLDATRERLNGWEQEGLPVAEVYDALHAADPNTLIVDKTPSYADSLEDLRWIGDVFPNARFLRLVRSPHDVIRSIVRLQLHKGAHLFDAGRSPYQVAEAIWVLQNTHIDTFLLGVPLDRRASLRYEDLMTAPGPELRRMAAFLDLPFEDDMQGLYGSRSGPVAQGAGDLLVNLHDRIEARAPAPAFYPVGARCARLAADYGYASS